MRLYARKARHLNVSEVIVIGIVSRPRLDVVACVGAVRTSGHIGRTPNATAPVLQRALMKKEGEDVVIAGRREPSRSIVAIGELAAAGSPPAELVPSAFGDLIEPFGTYIPQVINHALSDRFLDFEDAASVSVGVRAALCVFSRAIAPPAQILEHALEWTARPL